MSIVETVLIYAGIPLAVIATVYGIVYAGSARRGKRYRPGRPFEFRPVWFLAAPEQLGDGTGDSKALRAGDAPVALPPGGGRPAGPSDPAGEWPAGEPAHQAATGGASDSW